VIDDKGIKRRFRASNFQARAQSSTLRARARA
jgi:hypothetical protein